jgi:hypothetical protein
VAAYAGEPFQGGAFTRPRQEAWPFLDLETGERFHPQDRVASARLSRRFLGWNPGTFPPIPGHLVVGYGLAAPVPLPEIPGPGRFLLSWRDRTASPDARTSRLQSAPAPFLETTFLGKVEEVRVEHLRPRLDGVWESRGYQEGILEQRGLVPEAGAPGPGSLVDGPGHLARCLAPFDIASPFFGASARVFTEPEAHVLRVARGSDGSVIALAGRPFQSGFLDGVGDEARFNRPTYLAEPLTAWGDLPGSSCLLVTDSGNGAIRAVDPDARVVRTLLAGLKDPRGITCGPGLPRQFHQEVVYVAERGRHVIKAMDRTGIVRILAGLEDVDGDADGTGPEARFHDLKGLAADSDGTLYVLDGNALRRMTSAGEVRTLAGIVREAGFQDVPAGSRASPAPCMRDPRALVVTDEEVYISDTGNHCVRLFTTSDGALSTLAGDPARGEVAFGLLRDGLRTLPLRGYATLQAPGGIRRVFTAGAPLPRLMLATGTRLATLRATRAKREPLVLDLASNRSSFLLANFQVSPFPGVPGWWDFEYEATWTRANGLPAATHTGRARYGIPVPLAPGPEGSSLHVRCVTTSGRSLEVRK